MKPVFFRSSLLTLIAAAACLVIGGDISRGQVLEADYQLQDVYTSSVGTIGPLTVVGTAGDVDFESASVNGTTQEVLDFTAVPPQGTAGVQAQTAGTGISSTNYSVVLEAEFVLAPTDLVATKVLDFDNLSSDAGLYVTAANGDLEFINGSGVLQGETATQAVVSGNFMQIALTRNGTTGLVSVYENGAPAFSFTDSTGLAVLGDSSNTGNAFLTLFMDDGMGLGGTVLNESSEGELADLQIYNGVLSPGQVEELDVPEPSTIAMALGGLLLLGFCFRRVSKIAPRFGPRR